MIIKNAKIFDGEKFIEEDTVVLEGKFIKKVTDFSLIDEKELENQELVFITLKDALQTKQIVKEAKDRGILVNALLYPEFNDFYIQVDNVQPTDIQDYTGSHWKKIAFTSIAAFFILILGHILNLFISYIIIKDIV